MFVWCWVSGGWFLVWVFNLLLLIMKVDGGFLKLNLFLLGWRYAEISYYVVFYLG